MGKYVFERHFDDVDQKNAILAPLIDSHDPGRTVSREPNIHSVFFNNSNSFLAMSLSIYSTVQQKVGKINSLMTCLHHIFAE